jgi:hypothetical protein
MEDRTDDRIELVAVPQKEAPTGGDFVDAEEIRLCDNVVQVGRMPLG